MPKSYTVVDDYHNSRLDRWFKQNVINLPHSLIAKLIRQNKVKVNKKKTKTSYIPCSTDYVTMKGLVDKAKIKKKYPWSKVEKPKVMAIPLNQFISTLRTSEEDNIKEIRVIPTPSSIKAINQVNKK